MNVKESYTVTSMDYFVENNEKAPAPTPFVYRAMEDYARKNFSPWMNVPTYCLLAQDGDTIDVWDGARRLTHIKVCIACNAVNFETQGGLILRNVTHVMYPPKPPVP